MYSCRIRIYIIIFNLLSGLWCFLIADTRDYQSLAIMDYELVSGPPSFGWLETALPQNLSGKLIDIAELKVVDRSNLDSVFNELKLSLSGLTDETLDVGNLLIAEYYISGRISVIQRELSVFTRVTSSATGELVGAFTLNSALSETSRLEDEIVLEIGMVLGLSEPSAVKSEPATLSEMRRLHTVGKLYEELPFHELHPRRNRMKHEFFRSIDDMEELIMEGSFVSDLYYYLGQLYLQTGGREEALSYFNFMLENGMDRERAFLGLGDLYRFKREDTNSLMNYNKCLEENTGNTGALYGRCKVLIRLNRINEAFETLLFLIREKPDLMVTDSLVKSFSMYNDVLYPEYRRLVSLFINKRNPEEENLSMLPDESGILQGLFLIPYYQGVSAYQSGNFQAAETSFMRSFSLFSSFDMLHYYLGYTLFRLEHYTKAYGHFQTYIKLSREGDRFSEVVDMIRRCEERMP